MRHVGVSTDWSERVIGNDALLTLTRQRKRWCISPVFITVIFTTYVDSSTSTPRVATVGVMPNFARNRGGTGVVGVPGTVG